ncbi:Protein of unknown function DUF318, transmembrane [Desulfovibrio sp. X2]|uniref:permease n=1 Tax=Desulfovibrio sp. X2 TaxID=941449 RepID=UPI000358ACE8|nr:permease [Desulfovibrio sp. X2]EPR44275.1 Protein of unknown function DUF318, transmembrane [Desulfovibrio sp. X2]
MSIFSPENMGIFSTTCTAIVLEALPFLLLGSLVSGLFEVFVPGGRVERLIPRGTATGILAGIAMGVLLPTCECGVVPIVRRLLRKGFPAHAAFAYLLAAPVVNPVVLVATYVAFRGNLWMVGGRVAVVCLAAGVVGWIVSGSDPAELVRPDAEAEGCGCGHGHDHALVHDGAQAAAKAAPVPRPPLLPAMAEVQALAATGLRRPEEKARGDGHGLGARLAAAAAHMAEDFLSAGQYLVLGAMAAAAFKTFLPPSAIAPFEANVFLAVGAMIVLAVLLSVCSEADAFVAASFVSFPAASKLAFVTLGPIFDLKLLFMFSGTFKRRVVLMLAVIPALLVFVVCALLGVALNHGIGQGVSHTFLQGVGL